jgi:hypothetical protein
VSASANLLGYGEVGPRFSFISRICSLIFQKEKELALSGGAAWFFKVYEKKSGLNYSHANNCSKKSYKILPQISNFTSTRKKAINKNKKN